MSNSFGFMASYATAIQTLVQTLQNLQTMNQQITNDPGLITRYFNNTDAQSHRTDIVAQDVTNAQAAIVQMLFTFNSGSPTQASYLEKMMP